MRYKLTERQSKLLIEEGMPTHLASEYEWKGSINSVRIAIFTITDLIDYIIQSEHLKDKRLMIRKDGDSKLWDLTIQSGLYGPFAVACESACNAELIDALYYMVRDLLWKQSKGFIKM